MPHIYGRAPTFLMATGYEQARSIVAYLEGDLEAALKDELELPETGVCSISSAPNTNDCCMPVSSANTGCNDTETGDPEVIETNGILIATVQGCMAVLDSENF